MVSGFYEAPQGYHEGFPHGAPFDALVRWELRDGSQHSKPVSGCLNMQDARDKAGVPRWDAARSAVFPKLQQVAA